MKSVQSQDMEKRAGMYENIEGVFTLLRLTLKPPSAQNCPHRKKERDEDNITTI